MPDREELVNMVIEKMRKYRGLMPDRYKAVSYLDIDRAGEIVAEEIIDELEKQFELRGKKGPIKWSE